MARPGPRAAFLCGERSCRIPPAPHSPGGRHRPLLVTPSEPRQPARGPHTPCAPTESRPRASRWGEKALTWPPPENAAGACLTPRAYPPSACTLLLGLALDALCHTASTYCPATPIPQPRVDPQTAKLCSGKALRQESPFHPRKFNHLSGSTQTAHPQEAL